MDRDLPLLVTGAAGFIGFRFAEAALQAGRKVIAVDLESHFAERAAEHGTLVASRATIVDRGELFDWLKSEKPRLGGIVHQGACSDTMQYDVEYLRKMNVEYSKTLWEHATREKLPFVYASSAATYGAGEQGYDDDEARITSLKPLNPYGESKRLFDLWALEQERAGRTPPAWSGFKFFNVYGFGERHKGRMASVILHSYDRILKEGAIELFKSYKPEYRDGEQMRDFVAVDDVVSVLEFALTKPIGRGIYNLGTGKARTWLDLAKATFKALGRPEKIRFIDMPEELRGRYQYFTEAKMRRLREAGYDKPFLTLEEGVERYVKRLIQPGRR